MTSLTKVSESLRMPSVKSMVEGDSHPDREWARTTILGRLPAYRSSKVQELEERLRKKTALSFDYIMATETGFFLLMRFLQLEGSDDAYRLMFLKDCMAFERLRLPSARLYVARLIFDRYLQYEVRPAREPIDPEDPPGPLPPTVFDLIEHGAVRPPTARSHSDQKGPLSPPTSPRFVHLQSIMSIAVVTRSHLSARQLNANDEKADPLAELKQFSQEVRELGGSGSEEPLTARKEAAPAPSAPRSKRSLKKNESSLKPRGRRASQSQSQSKSSSGQGSRDSQEGNSVGMTREAVAYFKQKLDQEEAPADLFRAICDEIRDYLNLEVFSRFLTSRYYQQFLQARVLEATRVSLEDFQLIRTLGKGGFGTVLAVRKVDSGRCYAMKVIPKRCIATSNDATMAMLERYALTLVKSRFVCSLAYAFQDNSRMFLVMDLVLGHNLKEHMGRFDGKGFPENRAKYHAAEVLLALESLHSVNMIFRDLKLENVLLDELGHCKLCDLGLVTLPSKKRATTYSGTPGYIAPEIVNKQPYGIAVDLFSFGVMLYRMLSGKKPFPTSSRQEFDNAVTNLEPEYDPTLFSAAAIDVLKGLLKKDPEQRLGCGSKGMRDLKAHPFFNGIDWGLLEIGCLDPPYVPRKLDLESVTHAAGVSDLGDPTTIFFPDSIVKIVRDFEYVGKQAVRAELIAAMRKKEEVSPIELEEEPAAAKSCCAVM